MTGPGDLGSLKVPALRASNVRCRDIPGFLGVATKNILIPCEVLKPTSRGLHVGSAIWLYTSRIHGIFTYAVTVM